jgi:hypothetical protein
VASYKITGAHALNAFTQAKLIEAGFISLTDYKGLSPIIPAQQQPEFTNLTKSIPFIVYNYAQEGTYQQWWLEHEQVAYVVYTDDASKIRDIMHFLNQLYRRFDWSAQEINTYLAANGSATQKAFDFKYVRVVSATSLEPATEEGGRHSATLVLNTCFTSNLSESTGMRA